MPKAFLDVHHVVKTFGGIVATDDLSLRVEEGELHAVIGPNGAGKTTLMQLLSGFLKPTSGTITFDGRDITTMGTVARVRLGMARSFQLTSLWLDLTVLENVLIATHAPLGRLFAFWRRAVDDIPLCTEAMKALEVVGLADVANRSVASLSHGEQRQLELAVAIASRPRLLLLDEPMAGMGSAESAEITKLLRSMKRHYTIMLVEHDLDVVFELADSVSVLVYGKCVADGDIAAIRSNGAVQEAYLGRA